MEKIKKGDRIEITTYWSPWKGKHGKVKAIYDGMAAKVMLDDGFATTVLLSEVQRIEQPSD